MTHRGEDCGSSPEDRQEIVWTATLGWDSGLRESLCSLEGLPEGRIECFALLLNWGTQTWACWGQFAKSLRAAPNQCRHLHKWVLLWFLGVRICFEFLEMLLVWWQGFMWQTPSVKLTNLTLRGKNNAQAPTLLTHCLVAACSCSALPNEKSLCVPKKGDLLGLYHSFSWGISTYHKPAGNTVQQRGTSLKDSWVCGRKFPYTAGEGSARKGAPLDLFGNTERIVGDVMVGSHLWAQRSWNDNFWFSEK